MFRKIDVVLEYRPPGMTRRQRWLVMAREQIAFRLAPWFADILRDEGRGEGEPPHRGFQIAGKPQNVGFLWVKGSPVVGVHSGRNIRAGVDAPVATVSRSDLMEALRALERDDA